MHTEKKKVQEISISSIFGNKMLVTVVAVILVVSIIAGFVSGLNSATISLSAHFESISVGKNPDGSAFDIYEILSEDVLSKAAEKLDNKVDVEFLKKHLTIADGTSENKIGAIKQDIKDGEGNISFPSSYTLVYSTVSEDVSREGIFSSIGTFFSQLGKPSKKAILKAVAESYTEYYTESYVMSPDAIVLDWNEAEKRDYYNKSEYTLDNAQRLSRFIRKKYDENVVFEAESLMEGYGELSLQVSEIISVDVENYRAYVVQKGLTTDKDKLLLQLKYMEELKVEESKRSMEEYKVNKEAIEMYDPNVTRVVFIPSLDVDKSFYMNRTKVGVDYLIEQADSAKVNADNAEHDAIFYKELSDHFKKVPDADADEYLVADAMYENIKSKLNSLSEKVSTLVDEETQLVNREYIEQGDVYGGLDNILSIGISFVKSFVLLALIAFAIFTAVSFFRKK